ncbi:MAG: hypothetical protein U1F77_02800 [Kiritimatiellia bacterium]
MDRRDPARPRRRLPPAGRAAPAEIRAKHGLRNPFFLYAGTRSVRKNIRVLF